MIKITCDPIYKTLLQNGWQSTKDEEKVARLALQLFQYNNYGQVSFSATFKPQIKLAILGQRARAQEIQDNIASGKNIETGPHVCKWLKSIQWWARLEKFDEAILREIAVSYAILKYPYQKTRERNLRHEHSIQYWEKIQIKGAEILYQYVDKNAADLLLENQYALNRLLSFHEALPGIDWLQLLSDFSQDDLQLGDRLETMLGTYKNIIVFNLPKPNENFIREDTSFREYVAKRTIDFISAEYPMPEILEQKLCKLFCSDEQARLDIVYFAAENAALDVPCLANNDFGKHGADRSSSCFISIFTLYKLYEKTLAIENKKKVMEWVAAANLDSLKYNEYLAPNIQFFSREIVIQAIEKVAQLEKQLYVIPNIKNYLLHLMGLFAERPDLREKFSFNGLSSLEALRFLSYDLEAKEKAYKKYQKEGDSTFEDALSKAGDFTLEQKPYLYALYKTDPNMVLYLNFLIKLAEVCGKKFTKETAFHFLFCGFTHEAKSKRKTLKNLMQLVDKLTQTKKEWDQQLNSLLETIKNAGHVLKEGTEQINEQSNLLVTLKDQLCQTTGSLLNEIFIQVADAEQRTFCAQLQEEFHRNFLGESKDFTF